MHTRMIASWWVSFLDALASKERARCCFEVASNAARLCSCPTTSASLHPLLRRCDPKPLQQTPTGAKANLEQNVTPDVDGAVIPCLRLVTENTSIDTCRSVMCAGCATQHTYIGLGGDGSTSNERRQERSPPSHLTLLSYEATCHTPEMSLEMCMHAYTGPNSTRGK